MSVHTDKNFVFYVTILLRFCCTFITKHYIYISILDEMTLKWYHHACNWILVRLLLKLIEKRKSLQYGNNVNIIWFIRKQSKLTLHFQFLDFRKNLCFFVQFLMLTLRLSLIGFRKLVLIIWLNEVFFILQ